MNDLDTDEPAPRRKNRGCFKSCSVGLLSIRAVLTLVVWLCRAIIRRQGERQLGIVTRQLDADEPGWQLDAIESARTAKFPPPEQSPGPFILNLADDIPDAFRKWQQSEEAQWIGNGPANQLPREKEVAAMKAVAEVTRDVRAEALRLCDLPPGGFALNHATNPLNTLLPHIDKARPGAVAVRRPARGDREEPGSRHPRGPAMLGISRAIGQEPTLITQLVRIAAARMPPPPEPDPEEPKDP